MKWGTDPHNKNYPPKNEIHQYKNFLTWPVRKILNHPPKVSMRNHLKQWYGE